MTKHTNLTATQIEALRTEAGETGDLEMVRICESALDGDQDALLECVYVIESARAMWDDDDDTN